MRWAWVALAVALRVLAAGSASARETDQVTAEVLFQEARELLNQGQLDQACPRFLESERLDPATGTLLAVATCHERQGLLATAWAEFTEAAGRARQEGRKDRESLAIERVKSLAPRLSTLTLSVAPELAALDGLWIRRNGLEIGPAVYNRALPIDGGVHEIELGAPGYVSDKLSVSVARARDRVTLTLPALHELEPGVGSATPASPANAAAPGPPHADGLTATQVLGAGMSLAGIGAAAVGAGFFVGALIQRGKSEAYCTGNACEPRGLELRGEAVDRGNLATAFGVGGGLLAAAGVALYWIGGSGEQDRGISVAVQTVGGGVAAHLEVGF